MKFHLRGARTGWFAIGFALSLSSCKKDERAPTLNRGEVDCSEVPTERLPETSAAFEEGRCEIVAIDEATADYQPPLMQRGFVEVPLGPGSDETITLAIARIFSDSDSPKEDPIVYLDGGPGGPSIANADWLHPLIREMSPDRDIILVDQRGVGRSRPNLNCTEDDESAEDALTGCYERLSKITDLDEFDTINNASDFEYIRQALGYEQWNLLGISYGTRLGLTIMRDHPNGVRSALIDSVVPLQRDILGEIGQNGYNALSGVLAACAADSECWVKYPDTMGQLRVVVDNLNEEPEEIGGNLLSGDFFVRFIFELLYSPYSIAYIPRIVDDAAKGDFEVFENLVQRTSGGPAFSFGMHLSLHCAEEVPFSSLEEYEAFDAGVPEVFRASLSGTDYLEWCEYWPVEVAPASENEPVVSDIPALVLSGQHDPVTPPSFALSAHEYLTNSTYFMIENESHGASLSECGAEIAREFFDDPGGEIDAGCLSSVPDLEFLSRGAPSGTTSARGERIRFITEEPDEDALERVSEELTHRLR